MSNQTLELVGVIEEQQALIAELLEFIPLNETTQEIRERMGRIVAATERMKANFVDMAEIEKWVKAREEKEADREAERQELWQPGDEPYEPDYWGAYYE